VKRIEGSIRTAVHEAPKRDDGLAVHEEHKAVIRMVQDPFQQLTQQGGIVAAPLRLHGFPQLRHASPYRFEPCQCA